MDKNLKIMRDNERKFAICIAYFVPVLAIGFSLAWYFDGRDSFYLKAFMAVLVVVVGLWIFVRLNRTTVSVLNKKRDYMINELSSWKDSELMNVLIEQSANWVRTQAAIKVAAGRFATNTELYEIVESLQNDKNVFVSGVAIGAINEFENRRKTS